MKLLTTLFIFSTITILCFTTCKKYPENTIWFKNPKHIPIVNGYITGYKVNGIDSLDLLNIYYAPVNPSSYPPYTNLQRDIRKEHFQACCQENNHLDVNTNLYENLGYKLSENKKTVNIGGVNRYIILQKTIVFGQKRGISLDDSVS